MFDLSISEILIIAAVILIAVRPEDIPDIMSAIGKTLAKLKDFIREFSFSLDENKKDHRYTTKKIVDLEGNTREAYDVPLPEKQEPERSNNDQNN